MQSLTGAHWTMGAQTLPYTSKSSLLTAGNNPTHPRFLYLFQIHPSLPFPTLRIRIECVPRFSFLHRISCTRESLLSSSCAACTVDWCARLGSLPTFYNISCPVYLWTEHTYHLVPPDTVGWSILFTDFLFCLFPFFNSISYFGLKPAWRIMVGKVLDR